MLGLIILQCADQKFIAAESQLTGKSAGRRRVGTADFQYVPASLPNLHNSGQIQSLATGSFWSAPTKDYHRFCTAFGTQMERYFWAISVCTAACINAGMKGNQS